MKQSRKMIALTVAGALALLSPVQALAENPEFARDEETWAMLRDNVMEYGELAMLVEEYNPTYLNNQTSYRDNRTRDNAREIRDKQYEAANDAYDSADDMRSMAEDLKDSGVMAVMPSMASYYSAMMAGAIMTEVNALKAQQSADASYVDSQMEELDYRNKQNGLIVQTQGLFASYNLTRKSLGVLEKNMELAKAGYASYERQLQNGMATQTDLLNAQKNVQSLESTYTQTQAAVESLRQQLCLATGWQYNDQPEIRDLPGADLTRIDTMNPDADCETALANNLSLQYNRRSLTNMTEGSADWKVMERTIKNQEETIRAGVRNLYNDVIQKRTALQLAEAALASETAAMNAADTKLQLGMVSSMAHLEEECTFAGKQIDVETADMNLQQAIETYEWALKGYMN